MDLTCDTAVETKLLSDLVTCIRHRNSMLKLGCVDEVEILPFLSKMLKNGHIIDYLIETDMVVTYPERNFLSALQLSMINIEGNSGSKAALITHGNFNHPDYSLLVCEEY